MLDTLYNELTMEREIHERFGVVVDGMQPVAWRIPISHTGEATVFLSSKKQLYVYIQAESRLLLADVKKIIARMHLKPESFIPPKGRPDYFDEIGRTKFKEIFPGRTVVSDEDIIYYRTLAPYNPALVAISEVLDGAIYQFDTDASTGWRSAVKFTYRRIKTS